MKNLKCVVKIREIQYCRKEYFRSVHRYAGWFFIAKFKKITSRMYHKTTPILFILFQSFTAWSQVGKNQYRLTMINNSSVVATCSASGFDQMDTVSAGQKKDIVFEFDKDVLSFYLDLNSVDISTYAHRYKMIRVLDTRGSKTVIVKPDGNMEYELTLEEKVIAGSDTRLRTKNFWKLDSVIQANNNNTASAEFIYLTICYIGTPADTIQKYYNMLSPGIRYSGFGKRIVDYLESRTRLIVGKTLDNFELADAKGKMVKLTDIKSNYILLDFWFSRCGPCIASFPEIKELYVKTKRNKLAVIGISTDSRSENELWKETLSKHDMTWINLNDPKYNLVKLLAIGNYPTRVLLDKDYKIILLDTDNSQDDFFKKVEKLVNK